MLLAILGGAALVFQYQERARRPENVATLGQPLVRDLKAADITAIRIVEPKAKLTLERKESGWVIPERGGFPADVGKVREFVVKVLGLKVGQSEPISDKDRARLNLDDSATRVEFLAAEAKPLATLLVGKKYFKREVDNPDKAPGDGRFVMLPADTKTVYIISDPLAQASTKSGDWIDHASFQVEKVKTLEVRYPDGGRWRIERDADNSDWRLVGAKAEEKLDVTKANAASYSLGLLELADVAPKDASDTGLDNPTVVNATTLDGLAYALKVGKLTGDNYHVTFKSSGSPRASSDKNDAERIKKIEERLPREKLLSEHILLIAKSKLDDTLKKRSELLEKKDAAK